MIADDRFYVATSVQDAVAALAERGPAGAPLAGATWVMRAPLRGEPRCGGHVSIGRIDALRRVEVTEREISIGACATHAALAEALVGVPEAQALHQAAGRSANPAIREVATVGGNLCTVGFAAADLVPALMCLEAAVEVATPAGIERMALERFVERRADLSPGYLLVRAIVPRRERNSIHMRLPLRKAGDYPVAIVSLALACGSDGLVTGAAIAVGSVEPAARRWRALEADLVGQPLDAGRAEERAAFHAGGFVGRDGIEAPGWYRVKVLPVLVRRAVEALQCSEA